MEIFFLATISIFISYKLFKNIGENNKQFSTSNKRIIKTQNANFEIISFQEASLDPEIKKVFRLEEKNKQCKPEDVLSHLDKNLLKYSNFNPSYYKKNNKKNLNLDLEPMIEPTCNNMIKDIENEPTD